MLVGVTYSEPAQQFWLNLDVPEGATVREAIERSGVLKQFPQIDLDVQKVGVYSKVVKLDAPLRAGDRVEIYRAIICDPQTVPRRDTADED
ncbi:MAG TPA: RnfH family protein [Rhodocyclaceae bacterium]|nr:RnfH family protein [Rhodocyclaceae bacterium]